ncbi:MAG: HEAT repeat domain-containing protein [Clostridiaceae bacterium]|nr:HEAT repeat domain-containing protein [Clostridiaceae bacterium]
MGISLEKIEKWERKKNAKKLIRALGDDSVEIRTRAIRALAVIDDPEIRLAAVETLGVIGSGRTAEFVRALLDKEKETRVIEAAKYALAQIKEKMKEQDRIA